MSSSVASMRSRQFQRVDRRLLLDADDDGRFGIVRAFAALDRRAFANDPDVAYEHRGCVRGLDAHRGDGVGVTETADAAHEVFLPLCDLKSGSRVLVRGGQRLLDFFERYLVCRKARWIEDDLVLLLLASRGDHLRDARNGQKPTPDDGFRDGPELQRRVAVRLQIDEQDLAHDRGDGRQERRLDVWRQRTRDERELLRDGLAGAVDVLPPIELHPHDGDANRRRGAHPPNARGAIQRGFDREGDQRLDLERVHARRFGEDGHRRRGQIRQHVQRDAGGRPAAPDQERGGEGHHNRTMPERPANESVNHVALSCQLSVLSSDS